MLWPYILKDAGGGGAGHPPHTFSRLRLLESIARIMGEGLAQAVELEVSAGCLDFNLVHPARDVFGPGLKLEGGLWNLLNGFHQTAEAFDESTAGIQKFRDSRLHLLKVAYLLLGDEEGLPTHTHTHTHGVPGYVAQAVVAMRFFVLLGFGEALAE